MGIACEPLIELSKSYEASYREIRKYRRKLKLIVDHPDLMLVGGIEKDLRDTSKELVRRLLYELGVLSEESFSSLVLTERQKAVAILRQKHNNADVARLLSLPPAAVFEAYAAVIEKALKYHELRKESLLNTLSPQQIDIYRLYLKKVTRAEIARSLNISSDVVKTQLKRIRLKLKKGEQIT